jgi:hypothetical protein
MEPSVAHPTPYLAKHFSLAELTASQTAERAGLANIPNGEAVENLRRLAAVLEDVRALLGNVAVLVSSGYRSPALNRLVGGSNTSAHVSGCAADFIAPGFGTPRQVCLRVMETGIAFDQLIYEGTWVHLGIAPVGVEPRGQVLTAVFRPGMATLYVRGIQ